MHRKMPADLEYLSDFELMARAQRRHAEAFGVIVRRYQNQLLNFFRRLGVYTDAEDLVQECFLRVYRHRQSYRPAARFTTFLYRVGRNVWVDWIRRQARHNDFLSEYELEMLAREQIADRAGICKLDAQAALNALPEKLRLVVVMSIYQGMKYDEIAEVLEIPVGTVKSRMSIAFERLKEFMYADAGKIRR